MSETMTLELETSGSIDEDSRLVLAAQNNPAEFKQLYQKWLKRVYRYFYFRVGSIRDAEDLTSQVFLKIYEDLPRYRDRGAFSSWLFSIAHARAVDFYRKGGREVALEHAAVQVSSSDPLAQATYHDDLQNVLTLVNTLPDNEQELIRLRFMAELSYREIGQIVGRSEDAVRKALSRLLSRMNVQLGGNA